MAVQAGLCRSCSETLKTGLLMSRPMYANDFFVEVNVEDFVQVLHSCQAAVTTYRTNVLK